MNSNSFETDSKFNVTAAILLLATFSTIAVWILISGLTKDIGTITSITGAFRMWGLWVVIFVLLLITPVARFILYFAMCIKNKEWACDTKGVEMTSLGVVIGVLLVGVGIPKVIEAIGKYSDIALFSETTYAPLITATMVVVLVWFALFITSLILSIVADNVYFKHQLEMDKKKMEENGMEFTECIVEPVTEEKKKDELS